MEAFGRNIKTRKSPVRSAAISAIFNNSTALPPKLFNMPRDLPMAEEGIICSLSSVPACALLLSAVVCEDSAESVKKHISSGIKSNHVFSIVEALTYLVGDSLSAVPWQELAH